jgi:Fe-Mn family superoxide dismutase
MQKYEEQKFNIPELTGISKKSIEEHLKLYAGYVKHSNLIQDKIKEYVVDSEKNAYVLGELQRRFGFEFDGMRNHEYYFKSLEGGTQALPSGSSFKEMVEKQWGSWDAWLNMLKAIAMTRGIGWAITYYDNHTNQLTLAWIEEQHLGHLNSLQYIVGIDMWEHSFMIDYVPSEKKKYVEAYFANVNWVVVEENFKKSSRQ